MSTGCRFAILCASIAWAGACVGQDGKTPAKQITDIKELLTDTAAGHVSASGMLGIGGDAVTAVENSRTLVAAIKGLGTKDSQTALSFTPARSSLLPMSLSTYASNDFYRLLGNATVAYAQGTAKVGDVEVARRAFSLEAGMTFRRADDPLIGVYSDCKWEAPLVRPDQVEVDFTQANKTYTDCLAKKGGALAEKWNTSRFALSFGTGSVRPEDAKSSRLGTTVAASLVYGFDHFGPPALKEGAALAITLRHTRGEPVLEELVKGNLVRKNSSLAAIRLSGGSSKVRVLAEVSNARDADITASQQVYKQALGMDLRLGEGSWLNIRSGKQRKVTGDGGETVTLMNYSFSPKADLF